MSKKIFAVLALLVVTSMIFTACAPTTAPATPQVIVQTKEVQTTVQVVVTPTPQPEQPKPEAAKALRLNLGPGDVPTIDPAKATDTSSVQIDWLTFGGVTYQDEVTSAIFPGMATKWDISADGKTYTFHMRNDVPWVKWDDAKGEVVKVQTCPDADGKTKDRMVTANDFAYGVLRTLDPKTASDYAYVLAFAIAGAGDYNSGTITDTTKVGVKAVDDQTLEVTFKEAAAYNSAIAGMWPAYAQPKWLIEGDDCTEARGDRWTETGFFQGYGPYTMKEWVHDSTITLVKNPFWVGDNENPAAKVESVTFTMLDEQPAFAEFEAGNLDAAAVPLSEIDRVKADPELSKLYKVAPQLCTYYYGINTQAKFVDDQRLRLALSEAIDRQSLIDNVLKGGQEPAQWFARPGLNAAPTMADHPDLGVKFDAADAKAQLDAYLKDKNLTASDLDITLMFNTSSGHQKIAEAIQQMWKDNLGLDIKLANQEWKVFLKTILDPKNTPQIYRLGWCSDYADANNFDREVFALGGSANPGDGKGNPAGGISWKNDNYEKLVAQAATEQDPQKRLDLYSQAEEILVKTDAAILPIYWYTRNTATKPYVTRTFGAGGQEAVNKWDIDMTAKGQ